jgi:transposase
MCCRSLVARRRSRTLPRERAEAVDQVRRQEAKELAADDDDRLKGTRYAWLRNPLNESAEQKKAAQDIRSSKLKTARAWQIKETLMDFFSYFREADARRHFDAWHRWASRCRLKPMQRLAKTLKSKLGTLLNWCRWPITNAMTEGLNLNSKIQWIKYTARGFRSRNGFCRAILFHCGKLNFTRRESRPQVSEGSSFHQ